MPGLHVPTRFRPALIRVADLTDEALEEISGLLESHPDVLTSRDVAHDYATRLTTVSVDEGRMLMDALIPLLFYKASSGNPTKEVLKETIRALKSGDKDEAKLLQSHVAGLERNLGRLLDLSGIAVRAKALSLATDCPRLFTEARIISDVRPIFGAEVSSQPLGAAIVHSLKIAYAENGEEKEFFVQLDARDLRDLQEWLSRALTKDSSLKAFLAQAKLQIFDTSINT